jgi:hypothetical protein
MARESRTLALLLVVALGATWTVAVHAEDTAGGPATAGNAAASGDAAAVKRAKPAPKSGGAATSKAGTGAKGGKGTAAKGGSGTRAKTTTPAETVSGPEVRNFQAFCDEWMQKLRDRETYNTSHIAWDAHDGHVSGEYVGYDTKCTCSAREEPGKDPIGKITYRETRYRREGANEAAALTAPGTILEQSDVTEIFRFGKGRWQY